MGAEDSSRFFQGAPNLHCLRVRATEDAPRVRQRVLERTRGLAEIVVERFVGAERRSRISQGFLNPLCYNILCDT